MQYLSLLWIEGGWGSKLEKKRNKGGKKKKKKKGGLGLGLGLGVIYTN